MLTSSIHFISIWIVLLPVVAGIIRVQKFDLDAWIIWLLVIFASFPQLVHYYINDVQHPLEKLSYNVYTYAEFILLSFLFSNKLTGKIRKLIFRITVGAYIVILVARLLISSPDNSFDNTLVSINNYFYAIWILMIIREQFEKSEIISLDYYSSFFWYMLGIFLYSVGTMLFFILWYDLDKENYKELKIWLHSIFNILMYIFFAIGLWISALKTKTVKVN